MTGFTDMHGHFIYGVDDGASNKNEMFDMLDAAVRDGVTTLIATSHITPGIHPFPFRTYKKHFYEAAMYCREHRYPMRLYSGAEIMFTPAMYQVVREKRMPTLGNSSYILMEFVPSVPFQELKKALELMHHSGYKTILAHIERYHCLYSVNLSKLKDQYDVRFQVNCSTVADGFGLVKDIQIHKWFQKHLIDRVASDAHNCGRRPTRMAEAFQILNQKYGLEYAQRLMT